MGKTSLILATVFLLFSCKEQTLQNPDDIVFPDSNVSFQQHTLPVLKANCGLSYCHGEVSPRGNVQIYDYFSIMNSLSGALVIPYNPDGSVLVQIIEYRLPHNPSLLWKFSNNQKNGIRTWIREGAKNN